jgi:hypothetical protein
VHSHILSKLTVADLATGVYKVVMSALLPNGDKLKKADWQFQESVVFGIASAVA